MLKTCGRLLGRILGHALRLLDVHASGGAVAGIPDLHPPPAPPEKSPGDAAPDRADRPGKRT
ncbi:protein of unknown function [Rhodovastum atsumiense]|uniref:hypothetical protein n=1 Tax=Rhodovastum atsumiense TaxID=504468 RepID=UPI002024228C|nr:hypothetical protein [Rhodovastum atsumiense]CAH2602541.1 protein of unknown function [Rhodovastum atsumiense]